MDAQYRASMCKSVVDNLSQEAPALFAMLPPDDVSLIRDASRSDWIVARVLEGIHETIVRHDGENALRDLNRRYTRKAMQFAVYGPIVRGAVNVFGGGPRAILRVMPKSWEIVTRGCGSMSVIFPAEREASIVYESLPTELQTKSFVVASEASPLGLLDGLGYESVATSDVSALAEGRLYVHVRWWTPDGDGVRA